LTIIAPSDELLLLILSCTFPTIVEQAAKRDHRDCGAGFQPAHGAITQPSSPRTTGVPLKGRLEACPTMGRGLGSKVDRTSIALKEFLRDSSPTETERGQCVHDPLRIFDRRQHQQIHVLGCPHIAVEIDRMATDEGVLNSVLLKKPKEFFHVGGELHE